MPRSKVSKESKPLKDIEKKIIEDFKIKSAVELKKLQVDLEMYLNTFINTIHIQLYQIPPVIQEMTLEELMHLYDNFDDEEYNSRDSSSMKSHLRYGRTCATASDDGYVTDKTRSYKSKLMSKRKSNDEHKSILNLKSTAKKKMSNIYAHTPKNHKPVKIEPITPKVYPDIPLNVLRKPRNGETVISMAGSPLLVSSNVQENHMANLLVPLNNGDVISLLPTGDLRESMLPVISPKTRVQLRALKNHIEKFIS